MATVTKSGSWPGSVPPKRFKSAHVSLPLPAPRGRQAPQLPGLWPLPHLQSQQVHPQTSLSLASLSHIVRHLVIILGPWITQGSLHVVNTGSPCEVTECVHRPLGFGCGLLGASVLPPTVAVSE